MRRIVKSGWAGALMGGVVALASSVGRAETKAAATIISPPGNSVVGRVTEVVFETTKPGIPLVLVSADETTVEWWVQPLAKAIRPGRYTVAAHFGNSKTPQGQPFQVTVLLAPSERTAESMVKQQVFSKLPTGFVMSNPVRVLRRFEGETTTERVITVTPASRVVDAPAAIMRIKNGARVARRQEVHGTLEGLADPVILVRAAAANSLWWVQDPVQRDSHGEFTALVRFGNDKTPTGSEFHMVVVTPRSDSARLKAGDSLKELPTEVAVSSQMTLVLSSEDAVGAE